MGAVMATPVALTGTNQMAVDRPCIYRGITVRETAGAVATVRVFDHASAASGTLLETVSLAAGASLSLAPTHGVRASAGIYVAVTGTVEGSLRVG